jgi:hypothetical protein
LYYAGGIRAIQIVNNSLVEVGSFLDPKGNAFWGIETKVINGRLSVGGLQPLDDDDDLASRVCRS